MNKSSLVFWNVLVIGGFGLYYMISLLFPESYYIMVQEDHILEWASFWTFFVAGIIFGRSAWNKFSQEGIQSAWFLIGLSLFCFFVAFEEISWGQRILGLAPPAYFLENNVQQEINIHNFADNLTRELVLYAVMLGFGVILPLIGTFTKYKSFVKKAGIFFPPIGLAPSFFFIFLMRILYPMRFSGEVVELMLGLLFMLTAIYVAQLEKTDNASIQFSYFLKPTLISVGLSLLTFFISRNIISEDPSKINRARIELEALKEDYEYLVQSPQAWNYFPCVYHKRLAAYFDGFTIPPQNVAPAFYNTFRMEEEKTRADYFIDPWNYAYWIRVECVNENLKNIHVYSMGPDRQRQSMDGDFKGDDLVVTIPIRR